MNKDNIKAIVYTSETGHTAQYAELLGKRISLPVYEMKDAMRNLEKGTEIFYMGWLMAGQVKGYNKAVKVFKPAAVCAVGMASTSDQEKDIIERHHIPDDIQLFSLQGGFEMEKLHGIYRFMMNTMKKTFGKTLMNKADRTEEEDEMLDILMNGKNTVSDDKLDKIVEWINS